MGCYSGMQHVDPEQADSDLASTDILKEPALGSGPGVLVLHSGRGLTDFVNGLCGRLARQGFVAMAVDLFDGETPETVEEATQVKEALDTKSTKRLLQDSATFLRDYDAVSRREIGILGLGYGAEWACWLASDMPDVIGSIVLFYGYRDVHWETVTAPVLGHFAEIDHEIPVSRVNDIREEVWAAGVHTDFFVYSGTEPSFFEQDSSARYSPQAANLAWERTVEFLDRTLRDDAATFVG